MNIKIIIYDELQKNGFKKENGFYLKNISDAVIKAEIQKSKNSNGFYINYEIYANKVKRTTVSNNGDIFARVIFKYNGVSTDLFDSDEINDNELISIIQKGIKEKTEELSNIGMIGYIKQHPGVENMLPSEIRLQLGL